MPPSHLDGQLDYEVTRCGPVGAGCAVKAINNVMNSAHLLLATEGMLALKSCATRLDLTRLDLT